MPQDALVSVIIPAYNAETYIRSALESVLTQTYEHLEVIIVDDGSEDRTSEIVAQIAEADARVKLLRQPNQGVASARNLAIEYAQGTYIAPLDADDVWYPRKIEEQVRRIEEGGAEMGMVYTWWIGIDGAGTIKGSSVPWEPEGAIYPILLYINFVGNASVPLFRRSALEQVGLYDPGLHAQGGQGCEDWDLSLRVAERFEVGLAPAYLAAYRSVSGSMSRESSSMAKSYELVIQSVKHRHPEIPAALYRWSQSNFNVYLANMSYAGGNYGDALFRMGKAFLTDPAVVLEPRVVKRAARSLLRLVAKPVTSRLWPSQDDWIAFKKQLGQQQRPISREEIDRKAKGRTLPWNTWKPYDLIRARRWRLATACAEQPARKAQRPEPVPS